jgi:hypothetical protein
MKRPATRTSFDGFGDVKTIRELEEVLTEGLFLNPWKGRYHAALRRALGH